MADVKKVKVCKRCSGFDATELEGKVYGFLSGKFVVCDSKEAFLARISDLD